MIKIIVKIGKLLLTTVVIFFLCLGVKYLLINLGFITVISPISGNSMEPTLHNKQMLHIFLFNNNIYKIHGIKHGDLVAFSNSKTEGSSYIKRVIGLPGDVVEISNGYVSVNNQKINEKYILQPRSTFGGDFIQECTSLTVPQGSVFVLGDNRKRSLDSRDLGFISIADIDEFLPFTKQEKLSSLWRDTSQDFSTANFSIFNVSDYYQSLNKYRQDNGQKPLKIDTKLEKLATLRAQKLVNQYHQIIDKTKSDAEYRRDINSVGYTNIINEEISTFGFYESEELMDYWREKRNDNILLNKEFTETGISSIVAKVDGCEVQIVVQEFGGYRPPNYTDKEKKNIENIISSLKNVLPSLKSIVTDNNEFYQSNSEQIEKAISIISDRITQYSSILETMNQNRWLSNQQQQFINNDPKYQQQQQDIVSQLNDKIRRENSH